MEGWKLMWKLPNIPSKTECRQIQDKIFCLGTLLAFYIKKEYTIVWEE